MTGGTERAGDLWATVPRLLALHRYLVLGTVDPAGTPWVSPLFYAADGERRIVWLSSPDSRHSRNIAADPAVAVTLFDTDAPVGGAEAVYAEATAGPVEEHDRTAALELLNARLPAGQRLTPADLVPTGLFALYEARITQHFVLVRGGDPRSTSGSDSAVPVTPA